MKSLGEHSVEIRWSIMIGRTLTPQGEPPEALIVPILLGKHFRSGRGLVWPGQRILNAGSQR